MAKHQISKIYATTDNHKITDSVAICIAFIAGKKTAYPFEVYYSEEINGNDVTYYASRYSLLHDAIEAQGKELAARRNRLERKAKLLK